MQFPSPCGDYGSYLEDIAEDVTDIINRFPSPCGDYGSYQALGVDDKWFSFRLFPSPCGDYGSYRDMFGLKSQLAQSVSVPLRGLWFLSQRLRDERQGIERFRPLAGIMVLMTGSLKMNGMKITICFRPLAGIMVLIHWL